MVHIYTDGSYNSQWRISGWGFVAVEDGEVIFEDCGWVSDNLYRSRNITGELAAAMEAVKWAKKKKLRLYEIVSDYIGVQMWALGKWRAKKHVSKNYVKFMTPFLDRIIFKHVKGHSGDEFNDIADRLAEQGKLKKTKKGKH